MNTQTFFYIAEIISAIFGILFSLVMIIATLKTYRHVKKISIQAEKLIKDGNEALPAILAHIGREREYTELPEALFDIENYNMAIYKEQGFKCYTCKKDISESKWVIHLEHAYCYECINKMENL